jgi:hypothetical protein
MKAFRAFGNDAGVTAETPRKAALAFFERFPNKRKCDVVAGESEGGFFSVRLSLVASGGAQTFKDVTKKTAAALPDSE